MTSPLEARSLSLVREGNPVLDGVSFSVAKGEIFALLGGNGAGKSSTLLTFLGFLDPSGGEVLVNGLSVGSDVAAARNSIAYLPEAASLYGHMTAYENLDYFLDLAGKSASRADINAALDRVALPEEARTRRLQSYSKGMRQKTAIALALLRETPILLLDEPTSGLDPVAIDEFHDLVKAPEGTLERGDGIARLALELDEDEDVERQAKAHLVHAGGVAGDDAVALQPGDAAGERRG